MDPGEVELLCRELVELVTDYLGGTLAASERARLEQHLDTCPPCTAYLAQVRTTLALAAELGAAEAPPAADVAQELGELFRRWHARHRE
jgi:anti-sigma factor RsiW